MGTKWSQSTVTAMKPEHVYVHEQRMLRVFNRLLSKSELTSKNERTFYIYVWKKSFSLVDRPLDCHLVADVTLDKRHFVAIELCKKRSRDGNYTLYPDARFIEVNDCNKNTFEYVGSKTLSGEEFEKAAEHFVEPAIRTMLEFGGYSFPLNNCQDFIDLYLTKVGVGHSGMSNIHSVLDFGETYSISSYYTHVLGKLQWLMHKITFWVFIYLGVRLLLTSNWKDKSKNTFLGSICNLFRCCPTVCCS